MAKRVNNDAEHNLAAEWMCFFRTVPKEDWGVSLIKKELEGIDYTNVSLKNRPLMEYVRSGGNRHLALGIVRAMSGELEYYTRVHKMPILHDELSHSAEEFRRKICESNEDENTAKCVLNAEQEMAVFGYSYYIQSVSWHIEVLRRAGLSLRGVGIYDVLMEGYSELIMPAVIDLANELEEWIELEDANHWVRNATHVKNLRKKIEEIDANEDIDIMFEEPEEIVEYIARELMGWIK